MSCLSRAPEPPAIEPPQLLHGVPGDVVDRVGPRVKLDVVAVLRDVEEVEGCSAREALCNAAGVMAQVPTFSAD